MWDDGTLNYRSEELGAFFESKGFESAANGVEEDIAGGLILANPECQLPSSLGSMMKQPTARSESTL